MEKFHVLKFMGIFLVWLLILKPCVGSSYLTVWSGPECNTQGLRFSDCGCHSIPHHGGYEFIYEGQDASLYNTDICEGPIHTTLVSSTTNCTSFGWNSVFISCL
ncbi:hypothetical protein SUGI_0540790 [Cryptomeria japonica]|nr:hypothetical protein SUGI_0540790 [Cryptomeria japonica]